MLLPISSQHDILQLWRVLTRIGTAQTNFGPLPGLSPTALQSLPAITVLAADPRLDNAFDLHILTVEAKGREADRLERHHAPIEAALRDIGLDALADTFPAQRHILATTPVEELTCREDNGSLAENPDTQRKLDAVRTQWDTAFDKVDMPLVLQNIAARSGWIFVSEEDFDRHYIDLILSTERYAEMAKLGRRQGQTGRTDFGARTRKGLKKQGLEWQFDIWHKPLQGGLHVLGQTSAGPVWAKRDAHQSEVTTFTCHVTGQQIARIESAAFQTQIDPAVSREGRRLATASARIDRTKAIIGHLPGSTELVNILSPRGIFGLAYYRGGMGCSNMDLWRAFRHLILPVAALLFGWIGPYDTRTALAAALDESSGTIARLADFGFVALWIVLAIMSLSRLALAAGLFAGTLARGFGWFPRFSDNLRDTGQPNLIVNILDRRRPPP